MRLFLQTKIAKTLGMFLALFGIAVTFASCYGMPPEDPDRWGYVPYPWEDDNKQPADSLSNDSVKAAEVIAVPQTAEVND